METSNESQIFGIKELYCPATQPQIDIVAVHGLNGDALRTWTSDKSKICWLNHPDLLPHYVKEARVLTWGYNANIASFRGKSTSEDRILQHAHTLVAQLFADREMEGATKRPIIFLCHSLGGIIVKRALAYSSSRTSPNVIHMQSIYTCTFGILFFGTPHAGATSKAHLVSSLQRIASISLPKKLLETDSGLVRALEQGSETLENITDQFAPLMPRFRIFFFWEQERTDLRYSRDYIVDNVSAAPIVDGTERGGIAADHRTMCKFDGRDSPGFRVVVAALRRYARDAPKTIEARTAAAAAMMAATRWHEASELVGGLGSVSDDGFGGRQTLRFPPRGNLDQ